MDTLSKFADLISPCPVELFFREYYEKQYLHIERENSGYYDAILNAEDLDLFFQNQSIPTSMLRVVKEGKDVPTRNWCCNNAAIASTNHLFSHFKDGHTWVINAGNRMIPKLSNYGNDLERELQIRLQANIYVTPANAKGFAPHFDDHDVFILQTTGTKRWRLYNTPVLLPSPKFSRKKYEALFELEHPSLEVELQPGDLLYIPRGLVHDAVTTDQASIHITLGLHPNYFYELVQELARVAEDDAAFRRAMPNGLTMADQRAAIKADFLELTHQLLDQLDLEQLLEKRLTRYLSQKPSEGCQRFQDAIQVHQLTLESVVRKRENVLYHLERQDNQLRLHFAGKVLEFGLFSEPSLQDLLQPDSIVVKDIGGLINDQGRLDLATQFVQEGLSRIEALNA